MRIEQLVIFSDYRELNKRKGQNSCGDMPCSDLMRRF